MVGATVTAAMTAGLTVWIGWIVLEGAATCASICGG
jgi:hypothetical protein